MGVAAQGSPHGTNPIAGGGVTYSTLAQSSLWARNVDQPPWLLWPTDWQRL